MAERVTLEKLDKKINYLTTVMDKKFKEHDKRFDAIDKRLDRHDKRFDAVDKKILMLFQKSLDTNKEIEDIKKNMATKDDINNLTNTIDKFMKRIEAYYLEMLSLKVKVDRMEGWIIKIANKVNIKLEDS